MGRALFSPGEDQSYPVTLPEMLSSDLCTNAARIESQGGSQPDALNPLILGGTTSLFQQRSQSFDGSLRHGLACAHEPPPLYWPSLLLCVANCALVSVAHCRALRIQITNTASGKSNFRALVRPAKAGLFGGRP